MEVSIEKLLLCCGQSRSHWHHCGSSKVCSGGLHHHPRFYHQRRPVAPLSPSSLGWQRACVRSHTCRYTSPHRDSGLCVEQHYRHL